MRKFWIITLVAVGIFIFGVISKGGFGPPPDFLTSGSTKQPPCPEPLILETPVDMSKVTSILYPGQERGGDFKSHGGFRFDNSKPDGIVVKAPIDSKLQDIQKYMENGEVQYMADFVNPCGIVYRLDHLLTLAPKFTELSKKLRTLSEEAWQKGDEVTQLRPGSVNISFKKGEVIATAVGFRKTNNVFVDFGVYDLRGKSLYQNPRPYAVCWFDLLPPEDAVKVKSLPSADGKSGTQSAYCR